MVTFKGHKYLFIAIKDSHIRNLEIKYLHIRASNRVFSIIVNENIVRKPECLRSYKLLKHSPTRFRPGSMVDYGVNPLLKGSQPLLALNRTYKTAPLGRTMG